MSGFDHRQPVRSNWSLHALACACRCCSWHQKRMRAHPNATPSRPCVLPYLHSHMACSSSIGVQVTHIDFGTAHDYKERGSPQDIQGKSSRAVLNSFPALAAVRPSQSAQHRTAVPLQLPGKQQQRQQEQQ